MRSLRSWVGGAVLLTILVGCGSDPLVQVDHQQKAGTVPVQNARVGQVTPKNYPLSWQHVTTMNANAFGANLWRVYVKIGTSGVVRGGRLHCEVASTHPRFRADSPWRLPLLMHNHDLPEDSNPRAGFLNALKFEEQNFADLSMKVTFTWAGRSFESLWRLRARARTQAECQAYTEICTELETVGGVRRCAGTWHPIHQLQANITNGQLRAQYYTLDQAAGRDRNPWTPVGR